MTAVSSTRPTGAPPAEGQAPARLEGALARARRIGPAVCFAFLVVGVFLVMVVIGDWIAPHPANAQQIGNRLAPPVWQTGDPQYLLGADQLGRDILSRIIAGARPTALVAALVIVVGGGTGGILAIVAGYYGGAVDSLIMRAADATLSFPTLLLALVFAVTFGPGVGPVVLTLSIVIWARFARVVRAEVLVVRERDWIRQARVNGCSALTIMRRHVLPHVLNTWIVIATLQLGAVILLEASLSFLGVGVPPPEPSWGQMTAAGRNYLATAWWVSIFPGIAITLLIIAFNLLGDWVRDALDPRQRQI